MDDPELLDADMAPEDFEAQVDDETLGYAADRVGWGRAIVDGKDLRFDLYYDEPALIEALHVELPESPEDWGDLDDMEVYRRWQARRGLAIADATESFVRDVSQDVRARITIEWGGPSTAGPGAIEGQVLSFLLGDQPIDRLASLIEIAGAGWLAVKAALAATSERPVGISDGWAVVIATRSVEEAYEAHATDLVEVTPLHPHNPDRFGTPEGYAVQLRDDDWLYSVVVSFPGDTLSVNRVELGRLSQRIEPEAEGEDRQDVDGT
jgi:hypothetical protein